jgi:hypothetical protein
MDGGSSLKWFAVLIDYETVVTYLRTADLELSKPKPQTPNLVGLLCVCNGVVMNIEYV